MCVRVKLNIQLFTIQIVKSISTKLLSGYSCEAVGVSSVQLIPSATINEIYKNIFRTITEYNGQAMMGFNDE